MAGTGNAAPCDVQLSFRVKANNCVSVTYTLRTSVVTVTNIKQHEFLELLVHAGEISFFANQGTIQCLVRDCIVGTHELTAIEYKNRQGSYAPVHATFSQGGDASIWFRDGAETRTICGNNYQLATLFFSMLRDSSATAYVSPGELGRFLANAGVGEGESPAGPPPPAAPQLLLRMALPDCVPGPEAAPPAASVEYCLPAGDRCAVRVPLFDFLVFVCEAQSGCTVIPAEFPFLDRAVSISVPAAAFNRFLRDAALDAIPRNGVLPASNEQLAVYDAFMRLIQREEPAPKRPRV
jgi:hypothetical protein